MSTIDPGPLPGGPITQQQHENAVVNDQKMEDGSHELQPTSGTTDLLVTPSNNDDEMTDDGGSFQTVDENDRLSGDAEDGFEPTRKRRREKRIRETELSKFPTTHAKSTPIKENGVNQKPLIGVKLTPVVGAGNQGFIVLNITRIRACIFRMLKTNFQVTILRNGELNVYLQDETLMDKALAITAVGEVRVNSQALQPVHKTDIKLVMYNIPTDLSDEEIKDGLTDGKGEPLKISQIIRLTKNPGVNRVPRRDAGQRMEERIARQLRLQKKALQYESDMAEVALIEEAEILQNCQELEADLCRQLGESPKVIPPELSNADSIAALEERIFELRCLAEKEKPAEYETTRKDIPKANEAEKKEGRKEGEPEPARSAFSAWIWISDLAFSLMNESEKCEK